MKKILNPQKEQWEKLLTRPAQTFEDIEKTVDQVFEEVKSRGDEAITKYTKMYDGVSLDTMVVSEEEIKLASQKISEELKEAIEMAKRNIEKFHKVQKTGKISLETMPGVSCWQEKKPIQKVGLYIPGGTAPLFSTILMLAIPANIAECEEIVLCSPPDEKGGLDPAILYAAYICGVTKIFKAGGIQAIAGMTFGTETIPRVYKLFGPGNQYVTQAKQMATKYNVAIDMPAGPSELLVIADDAANANFVASDLLSQAEHGVDSQVILISTSEEFIDKVKIEIEQQLSHLPRKEIAVASLANSKFIFMEKDDHALEMINEYAPEHLIICTKNEEFFCNGIKNAGSVFIGDYTPESAGDYASGTNHTLPTNGFSRQYSGVNLDSFMKTITFQKVTKEGIRNIGPAIEIMAEAEGLQGHKNAVSLRLKKLNNDGL